MADNLDFLAAQLHGRRAGMAEGVKLEALCRVQALPQLTSAIGLGAAVGSAAELQRRLTTDLAGEVADLAGEQPSAGVELLRWLATRFAMENVKVILRGVMAGTRPETWQRHLLALPREHALKPETVDAVKSVADIARLLPRGVLRQRFSEATAFYREERRPFFFEAALDRAYYAELLARTEALRGEDQELVRPLVCQEIDTYLLRLVARGRFGYGLEAKALLPMHVSGTGISRERFAAMLADADLRTAAGRALERALDALPSAVAETGEAEEPTAPADLEALAWNRLLRLANRAFRRSHMGLAAVVAFVAIRRLEVANLITLSEGIRAQLLEGQVRARLFPRRRMEVAHV